MKRLVVCCDGTWNSPGQKHPTNVVKMDRAVARTARDGTIQKVFYDPGVGTGNTLRRLWEGVTGWGVSKNVRDAYGFLVEHYEDGNEVFLFGFSRGAFTARSTAGFIRNCGLLYPQHFSMLDEAFELYQRRDDGPDTGDATRFRNQYSRDIDIKFLGVWDTIGALGIPVLLLGWRTPRRYQFHDLELSRRVKHAYQALSIDERAWPYGPSLWADVTKKDQVVEQVWFPGWHSDVGGGSDRHGLGDVSFQWMKEAARSCSLAFDEEYIESEVKPDAMARLHPVWWRKPFYHIRSIALTQSDLGIHRPWLRRILGLILSRRLGGGQSAHPAAINRFKQARSSYKPYNLKLYLARGKTDGVR